MSFFKKLNRLDWITLIIFTLIIIELFYSVVFQGRYETCEYPIYYFLFSVYFMVMVFRLVTRMGTVIPNYEDRSTKILLTYILPINFVEAIIGLYLQIGNQITTSKSKFRKKIVKGKKLNFKKKGKSERIKKSERKLDQRKISDLTEQDIMF